MKPILKFLSSLELTILCLSLSIVLIFFGTLDQANLGIHGATEKYFYSVFVYRYIDSLGISVPYMPGGYLIGFAFLINIVTVTFTRFTFNRRKLGIWMIHLGVILLLIGEFISSVFQEEASMTIDEGETARYTESFRYSELALIDTTDPEKDRVYAIPEEMMKREQQINVEELPFYVSIEEFLPNSALQRRGSFPTNSMKLANKGIGLSHVAIEIPKTGKTDERNIPSALVTLFAKATEQRESEVIGTWLAREFMPPQSFSYEGRDYMMQVRRKREYVPYEITLLDFSHDRYLGTNIPKNFSSDVLLKDNRTGQEQEFLIYMNNPLRYDDLTFYQQGFMNDDTTSILQVVRNPGRSLPYISCTVITLGLMYQFGYSLIRYSDRRKKKAAA
ncbi:cytochrome c biogenesis protein ResB [Pelagicoccus sp. SDUM812003]|uniref:cytochrome c biogenesis protein ResB n=1 Tax=Pelagicoccus sp. SDUM812003 TaxID=3041267 RepID=UPI00281017ED|nr:cytochrome c biogenesis protein ResB [Pelagicoccus sp. SDUM812003]MDQ8204560.1 cytochrome c biogenesis protein ResB [Pelagicoccus sp. SDUM812003]